MKYTFADKRNIINWSWNWVICLFILNDIIMLLQNVQLYLPEAIKISFADEISVKKIDEETADVNKYRNISDEQIKKKLSLNTWFSKYGQKPFTSFSKNVCETSTNILYVKTYDN